jgi:CHAD domain-containing protein
MAKAHKITGVAPLRSYHENARIILPQRLEEVYTWEPFIRDETRREELHNMRISIKRLRYTMELFRVAYRLPKTRSKKASITDDKRFVEFLAVIVDLQEILGDIHDADVVLKVLVDYTSQSGNRGRQIDVPLGVATLITRTEETRKADYGTFLEKWDQLSAAGFKQELLSFLLS